MKWPIPVNNRISLVYAHGLFSLLDKQDQKMQELVYSQFKTFVEDFLDTEPVIYRILCSPVIPRAQKVQILYKTLEQTMDHTLLAFIALLIQKNRFEYIKQINKALLRFRDIKLGILRGTVRIAHKLDKKRKEEIIKSLSGITGKNVEPDFIEDSSIVAGFRTIMGDHHIDYSIRGQLEQLKSQLKRS